MYGDHDSAGAYTCDVREIKLDSGTIYIVYHTLKASAAAYLGCQDNVIDISARRNSTAPSGVGVVGLVLQVAKDRMQDGPTEGTANGDTTDLLDHETTYAK